MNRMMFGIKAVKRGEFIRMAERRFQVVCSKPRKLALLVSADYLAVFGGF